MQPLKFRLPGGYFLIRLWPTMTTLLMLMVLIGLGSWQVERLHWKQNLIATLHERMQQAPVDVLSLDKTIADEFDYRHATARGVFDYGHEFYLSATSLDGQGGYHVLTPLRLENGQYLLVDRGWIPYDRKGKADGFGRPQGAQTLQGILRLPQHSWAQPANRPASNDWYWIDLPMMAKETGIPNFQPYILAIDAAADTGTYPIGGQTRLDLPNNHLQYILTWYGLAVALTIIYGIQGYRKFDS